MRNLLIVISAIFIFNGCGGSSSDTPPIDEGKTINPFTLSGKAVDSHPLADSTVCLDLNKNNSCEADQEPTATTDNNGEYTLDITEAHQKNAGYLTAKIILSGGKDVSTDIAFIGTLSTLFDSNIRDNILLTPLSTLVALLKEKNNLARAEAERQVALSFGLEVSQLSQDPLEALKNGDKKIFEANMKIQQSAQLIQSQDNLKKMEDIFKAFTENISNQKEFTDGLGSEDKIKILQKFIDEELAKLTTEALAQLNTDMRDLVAVTNSVDSLEFGLRDETNTTDFNTTQYIVNAVDLGDEYRDGIYLDNTASDINIVSLLAGKTFYRVLENKIESSSFNVDMTMLSWENVYGDGVGNKGTVVINVSDNKVIVDGSDTFWVILENSDYILLEDYNSIEKSYKDLEKAKAYYESRKIDSTTTTDNILKELLSGNTFYFNDGGLIKSIAFTNDATSLTVTTIQGTDTDGNGAISCQVIDNKLILIDEGNKYSLFVSSEDKYLLFDNYSAGGVLAESGMRFYFNQADAETSDTTSNTADINPSILAGKTIYFVSELMVESDTFNADMTLLTWENVYGIGDSNKVLGDTGTSSFHLEDNEVVFDNGGYFNIQDMNDTNVILWNGTESIKFYLNLDEAKAVYDSGSISTTIEDNDGDGFLSDVDPDDNDACSPSQAVGYRGYDNNNSIWQEADCDGDGVLNGTEDNISLAPNNYISDPYDSSSSCFTFNEKTYCTVSTADGRVWLDRNLGATKVCDTSIDTVCYGDLYQWGRGTDGHQERNSTRTQDLNPQTFPYSSTAHELSTTGNFDWLTINGTESTTGFVVERKASWSSDINNSVCPKNWYVPTKDELTALADAEGIVDSATAFSSPLRFAVSGSRSNASSSIEQANVEGYIWTTDTSDTTSTSYAFTYNDIETLWSRAYRATGYPVRCIKAQ